MIRLCRIVCVCSNQLQDWEKTPIVTALMISRIRIAPQSGILQEGCRLNASEQGSTKNDTQESLYLDMQLGNHLGLVGPGTLPAIVAQPGEL